MASTIPPRADGRTWLGLAVLVLPALLLSLDLTVLNLAIPKLTAELRPTGAQLLWILDIYPLVLAGLLIPMGALGDRIGRRRLLLVGAAAFGAASVFAAFSANAEMLIVARGLLGVAGSTVMPSTLSLIRNMFRDPKQRTLAISVFMSGIMVGDAIGPAVGGVLLEYFWWGSVFLLGVPVMLLVIALGPALLPEYRDPAPGRLDLTSAALLVATMLAVVFSLQHLGEAGLDPLSPVVLVIGLGLGVVFVRRQRRLADPLLDLRLFANRSFTVGAVVITLGLGAMFGAYYFMAQYLQLVAGLSPFQAGLATIPITLGSVGGIALLPLLTRWFRPARVMVGGLVVAALGMVVITLVNAGGGIAFLVIGGVLLFIGLGITLSLCTTMILNSVPAEKAGAASGVQETSAEMGAALGIAVLGSIGTAVYRGGVGGALPEGLPADLLHSAQGTLGGAVAAAAHLPGATGAELLDTARQAFTTGMRISTGIGVAVLLGLAVMAAVRLRGETLDGQLADDLPEAVTTTPDKEQTGG
ncbi:MFS transporter [Nonomuraea candida]|uniref:MFS transporter n=1 Tax=Nonomuraea candida TaxID=359159 RepID=UPI000A04010B|nr:MFS transporter [Nonomuraea candida]